MFIVDLFDNIMADPTSAGLVSMGMLGAIIGWGFPFMRRVFNSLKEMLFTSYTCYDTSVFFPYIEELLSSGKTKFNRSHVITETGAFWSKRKLVISIGFGIAWVNYNGSWLLVNKVREVNGSNVAHHVTLITWRFSKNSVDLLFEEAEKLRNHLYEPSNGLKYFKPSSDLKAWTCSDLDEDYFEHQYETSDYLKIKRDMDNFINSERQYNRRGIRYRRGYILEGPPGTGKSTLIGMLANNFNMNIYTIPASNIHALPSLLDQIPSNTIVALEDFDFSPVVSGAKRGIINPLPAIAKDSDSVESFDNSTSKSLFSDILNAMSGINGVSRGIVFVATTNNIESIDPALLRAGRFDVIAKIDYLDIQDAVGIIEKFYGEKCSIDVVTDSISDGLTVAKLIDLCLINNGADEVVEEILLGESLDESEPRRTVQLI